MDLAAVSPTGTDGLSDVPGADGLADAPGANGPGAEGLGAAVTRVEDDRLVAGRGRFVADLREPDCAEAVFVRSDVPHGRLGPVALDAARRIPGVLAAWTAADLPEPAAGGGVPRVSAPMVPAAEGRPWPALATDRVRYPGQPVAVVVAEDRYLAEDGRDAARLSIDPLPALPDPAEAADSAVELFPGHGNVAAEETVGDPVAPEVWDRAAVVVEASYRHPPLAHTSLEARAVLVRPDPDDGLTVWCSHQAPHLLRDGLSDALGLPPRRIRVVVPDVGGAFGGKSQTWPEYLAVAAAARRLGRPVRWVEDRAEALTAAPHGRGQRHRVRLAADADGRFLALAAEVDAGIGGYPHTGAFLPGITARMAAGAYATPRVSVRARAVLTTTAPLCPYRGAGRPEAAYAVECTVDLLARRLRLDPAELRRRNLVPPDAFPYTTPTGFRYDSGDYPAALDLALKTVDHRAWRAEQARRRAHGGAPLGVGLCCYVERSGVGPEFGAVEAQPDGSFTALSGCCATGQGHQTAFGQLVGSVLGVARHRVRLVEADTARVPRGIGSFASRSAQSGGEALLQAARALVDRGRERAAERLDMPPAEIHYRRGTLRGGGRELALGELADATGPLRAEATVEPPQAFPYGAYVAVVEVDQELGDVRVLRLVAVDDYGVVINPLLVRGQTYGSIAQGLGQALYEEAGYEQSVGDARGRPGSPTLLDYLLPTLAEMPPVTLDETRTPNPGTALGAKGAGEAGCIGTPPAVVNAVADALDLDPHALRMPLTPETCWEARR